jgi:hypothetical protein
MANPEMGLLSKIVRHDALKQAIEWGLRDEDFLTDEGLAIYQHMMMMIRDPRFNGSTPGVNMMATLYPNFDMCDDSNMSLEAYCTVVRENKLCVEVQGAVREAVLPDRIATERALRLIERLQSKVIAVDRTARSTRRTAAMFAAQPSPDELRQHLLVPALAIGPGAPTLLVAAGFTGKTTTAQSMALAVASGQQVWGLFDAKPGRVLHVDGEQGARTTEQIYRELSRGMGVDLTTLGTLAVEYRPPMLVTLEERARPSLNEWQLTEMVRDHDLVLVDNLAALSAGLQENSSEIRMVLDMLRRISEVTGATIVVLHHTTKPGQNAARGRAAIRGSSAIFEAASVTLMLERETPQSAFLRVTSDKARGGLGFPGIAPFTVSKERVGSDAYRLTASWEAAGSAITPSRQSVGDGNRQRVLGALRNAAGFVSSKDKLRRLAGIGSRQCLTTLADLERDGLVVAGRGSIQLTAAGATAVGAPSSPSSKRPSRRPHALPPGLRVATR